MKKINRGVLIIILVFTAVSVLVGCRAIKSNRSEKKTLASNPVKVSVFSYKEDDDFILKVNKYLEKIQVENPEKVQFTFYDSKNSQAIQNQNIDRAIKEGTDLLLVNLVNSVEGQSVVNKAKENNLPIILFNREPITLAPVKSYSKALFIGSDIKEGSALKAQIIIDLWNTNKKDIDRNSDGIMQYVTLSGGLDLKEALVWWKSTPEIIEKAGIKTQELANRVAYFDEELAKRATESLLFEYGDNIEVIISDDDTMAIGAINALQGKGFNKGDKEKNIVVVGVDAKEEVRQLIDKGFMTGSVIQNPNVVAQALYDIGNNLVFNKKPLEGTNYVFDPTGVAIRIPFEGVYKYIEN